MYHIHRRIKGNNQY